MRIQRLLTNICSEALKSVPEEEKICWKKKNSHKVLFMLRTKRQEMVFFFFFSNIVAFSPSGEIK